VQHAPDALASVPFFEVDRMRVEGGRYLELADAERAAALPPGFSIWSDLDPVAERLRAHPLVAEVRVRRRLPSTLVFQVLEREPVALLPTPSVTPVDAEGRLLPIDPARHFLDLPLLHPRNAGSGEPLSPVELRILAAEVARLGELEPRLGGILSEAALDPWGDVIVHLAHPATTLHFRPPLTAERLREGLRVLADRMDREPGRVPAAVDLRFADQVVVRTSPNPPR
jgi:hypothetical protein